ncbi:MAG: nucleotidyl transferase AbiEii/AbiGii toxin family protein [Comamonas sp.]|nr:nucleotidyl transferase AbiEii/AbiGii toxin family protein [Comamonas sp.]
MIEHQSLTSLVASTIQGGTAPHLLAAIESELLQLRLLRSLDDAGLLNGLVLHGGSAVRFCYGGNRFSDALSFAGGADFTLQRFLHIKQCFEADLGIQCELSIAGKVSSTPYKEAETTISQLDQWALTVSTSNSEGYPCQAVKLEVFRAATHTVQAMPIQIDYDCLPAEYSDIVVMVEGKKEVLAFMLASLPSLPRQARCTCLWDLAGLMRLGTPLDAELLKLKIANQRYTTAVYLKHIEKLACDLPSVINDGELAQTMQPLLPVDIYERTACDSRFRRYLVAVLGELLSDVKELLAQQSGTQPAFRM